MTTPTTNMNWTDPTVGASNDTWGDLTNAIWDNMDAHAAGLLYGLTLSAAGSTATFGIAAGAASGMVLASAYTKTTSAWGVGTGQGALDTGAIANSTWYHVWLIQRVDTLVVDVLVSLSATAPTMPTNYTRKRRIGSMKTDGSAQWRKFVQFGDEFLLSTAVNDFNTSLTTTAVAQNLSLSVPSGIQVLARLRGEWGNGTQDAILLVDSPDSGATLANSPTGNVTAVSPGLSHFNSFTVDVRTNTSGQVKIVCTDNGPTAAITTYGWVDTRGR